MHQLALLAAETASHPAKLWAYLIFFAVVIVFLAVDLGLIHRESKEISFKEASLWSVFWLVCGLSFGGLVKVAYDRHWLDLGLDTPRYNTQELRSYSVDVRLDASRLESLEISPQQVRETLAREGHSLLPDQAVASSATDAPTTGILEVDASGRVAAPSELGEIAGQLREIVVASRPDGSVVRLEEVAQVEVTGLEPPPLVILGEVTGTEAATQYVTGYIVEKSLAMDNIFVIALVFAFFAIPAKYQYRVLFWGILGAIIMRGSMIFIGSALIERYQWILIVFGAFLVLTALKMALIKGNDDPSQNIAVRIIKRFLPAVDFLDGQKFFTRRTIAPTYAPDPVTGTPVQQPPPPGTLGAAWKMTPLFIALILVEITDLVFAVDSIPAIFAITPDPFIVLTSNIFAILGLRALYFCLAALIAKFRFLKPALILILAFVGVKLLLLAVPPYLPVIGLEATKPIKVGMNLSLGVVLGTLVLATILSIIFPKRAHGDAPLHS